MTKLDFLKTLPNREKIYIIFSRLTNLPYVECNARTFDDEAFLFTGEEDALKKAKELSDGPQPAVAVKVEQKDMLKMFADLYVYGINRLAVKDGGDVLRLQLSELVRRPGIEKLPPEKRPLENPPLQLSMIYYLQEARKGIEHTDADHLAELEDEMAVNLIRAKYLLPVKEVEKDGRTLTQLLLIKTKDADALVPVFSDAVEYGKFRRDQDQKAAVTTFEKMAQMPLPDEVKGFMLNPAGAGMILTREYLKKELELNR